MAKKKFYKDLDKVKEGLLNIIYSHSKSKIIQEFFLKRFTAFIYGNLIQNFFNNLNQKNILKFKLPKGKIGIIKNKYTNIRKDIKLAISFKLDKVDKRYYSIFKKRVENDYPQFNRIFTEIEKYIDIDRVEIYLSNTKKELENSSKSDESFSDSLVTKLLEVYIQKKKDLPTGKIIKKMMRVVTRECLPKSSEIVRKSLNKNSKQMLDYQRKYQKRFESRLYQRWEKPIDLLECLIKISLESGEGHSNKLAKTTDNTNNFKRAALINIHARALHIANEILILLKTGYADGANARWRSLRELAVISFFLSKENNEISERYLDYANVRAYKEAKDYRTHYKKLGYKALDLRIVRKLERKVNALDQRYGDDFGKTSGDYNWIPRSILNNRNFTELEKHVKVSHLHPFYNLSCDSIHGGSKGFYRLGLMDKSQNKILLVGPSNYGLADPLQNTAISILHVNVSLLTIDPDFESILQLQVMNSYIQEIKFESVKIQKQIEEDEDKDD